MKFVFLALEPIEEAFDAFEIVFGIAFEDQAALLGGELAPRDVERNAAIARPFFHVLQERAITRFGPRFDGAFIERFAGIRDDEIEIEVDGVAEALATRASAVGIVEGKKARLGLLIKRAVVLAFEALIEREALGGIAGRIGDEFENGFAVAFAIANLDGVRESRARFGADGEAIDEHIDGLREIHVEKSFGRRKFVDAAILIEAIEAALLDVAEGLFERLLRWRRRLFLWNAARAACSLRLGRDAQQIHDVKAPPRGKQKDASRDFVGAVAANLHAALDAKGLAASREEQPQIIVNFRRGGDRRARVARGIFLTNGDGGSDAGNLVDIWLFHTFKELACIGGKRFDVAALAFGVNRVKGERGLAGAADASDNRDGVVRNFDRDVAQIMNAGAADADSLLFAEHGREFFSGQREAQTARSERSV